MFILLLKRLYNKQKESGVFQWYNPYHYVRLYLITYNLVLFVETQYNKHIQIRDEHLKLFDFDALGKFLFTMKYYTDLTHSEYPRITNLLTVYKLNKKGYYTFFKSAKIHDILSYINDITYFSKVNKLVVHGRIDHITAHSLSASSLYILNLPDLTIINDRSSSLDISYCNLFQTFQYERDTYGLIYECQSGNSYSAKNYHLPMLSNKKVPYILITCEDDIPVNGDKQEVYDKIKEMNPEHDFTSNTMPHFLTIEQILSDH